jgi:surface protein
MAQIPIPFSSSFRSLTLNVTTGTPPNQVTYPQPITSVHEGNNSFPITDASILTAFNSQSLGTTFTPSIVAKYGSDSNGNALTTVSTPSVASFIPRVISLANIPNKLTTDASFSLSSLITTVSTGSLSYSSSVTSVATVNSSTGLVTPVGAGTTTITVTQAATANHQAASTSATFTVSLPPPPISLAANNVTIQYTGTAGDVPTSSARFIQANPRGTGNEWFAVVKQGMKQAITDYAKGLSGSSTPFTPPGQSQPVPFNNIVTSLMTDMSSTFSFVQTFNDDISSWDTSLVTNMSSMFLVAVAFNQDISKWDTSSVMNMREIFSNANAFNKNIGSWNTSNVTDMSYMFYNTTLFNQPLNTWDTAKVTDMSYMFFNASNNSAFNQNIGSWDVSKVTDMDGMLRGANKFNNGGNSSIGSWNTAKVTNMNQLFFNASEFNQNLSGWNVALTPTRPSLNRSNFAYGSPLALPENSAKLPPFE